LVKMISAQKHEDLQQIKEKEETPNLQNLNAKHQKNTKTKTSKHFIKIYAKIQNCENVVSCFPKVPRIPPPPLPGLL
jgi:hypothetical protein